MSSRPRRTEAIDNDARMEELEALASRQADRIAFLDAKVAWLTLDRDRFRRAHGQIVRSLIWRIMTPFRSPALRAATQALSPQIQGQAPSGPVAAPAAELPEAALWIQQRLAILPR